MNPKQRSTSIFGDLKRMLENSAGSKFLLVNIVRLRSAQLNNGADPLTDFVNPNKPVSTAFNEVGAGMIPFEATSEVLR